MKRLWKIICRIGFIGARGLPPSYSMPAATRLRGFLARGILDACGRDVNVEHGCRFGSGIGIRLGDHSGIGIRAEINPYVTIGRHVMMAPDVVILTQNHRHDDVNVPMMQQGYDGYRPVIIEDDVWIGQRALILPGVCIGRGSIIGAGAVVTKSVPPLSIAAGNPARVVRSRLEPARTETPERREISSPS